MPKTPESNSESESGKESPDKKSSPEKSIEPDEILQKIKELVESLQPPPIIELQPPPIISSEKLRKMALDLDDEFIEFVQMSQSKSDVT